MNKSNYFAAVPVFAKLLQITLHYETRKLDTGNKMRKPEHINIYIIVRKIFFSCANPPTALFILINSHSETGRSCETGPWGFLSLTQFLPFEKTEGFRREEDEQTRKEGSCPKTPATSAISSGVWAVCGACTLPASLSPSLLRKVLAPRGCGWTVRAEGEMMAVEE